MTDASQLESPLMAELQAPSVEEMAAKQREENMGRAMKNGYREPDAPSFKGRVVALMASMEHAVEHNAPVTPTMLAEMRTLLMGG